MRVAWLFFVGTQIGNCASLSVIDPRLLGCNRGPPRKIYSLVDLCKRSARAPCAEGQMLPSDTSSVHLHRTYQRLLGENFFNLGRRHKKTTLRQAASRRSTLSQARLRYGITQAAAKLTAPANSA